MTDPTLRQAALAAASRDAAFALWRLPDGNGATLLVSLPGNHSRGAVDFADTRPAFAFSRYDNFDGGSTDLIAADAVITGGGIRFAGGDGALAAEPATDEQRAFADMIPATAADGALDVPEWAVAPVAQGQAHYEGLVEKTLAAIGDGLLEKAVGSRAVPVALPAGSDALDLFTALEARYPAAFICLTWLPGIGVWIVATPERLMSVDGTGLSTMALAGTQTLAEGADVEAVSWRGKFIEEQALVCRYMRDRFHACGFRTYRETGPRTVRAANLAHLRSVFTVPSDGGDFTDDAAFRRACNALLKEMHPTSAVCGMPRQPAIDFLEREEGYDRAYYCGYLGPLNIDGSSDLFVNLRAAQIIGRTVHLYVGAGLVDGSVPADEWQETVEKSKTLGAVIAGL
jgi:isochorismate synthase